MNASAVVICRVKPAPWWLIVLGASEAAFMLAAPFGIAASNPPGKPDWVVWVIFGPVQAIVLYGVVYYALYLARGFVRADAKGLSWRGIVKFHSARWDEVTDFYDVSSPHGARNFVIETRTGTLKMDGQWTNTGALRDFIQHLATQSLSHVWALHPKGENWPRVFHYRGWENRWFLPFITTFGILGWPCIFGVILFRPQAVRADFTDFGVLPGILFIIGKLCMIFGMPILYSLSFWPTLREVRRRQNERISATPDSLTFEDGARRIEARWDEITNFYRAPSARKWGHGVYVVETAHGNFDFMQELGPYQGLQRLIQERATNSASREWKTPGAKDIETIGGEKSKWRDGQRVYSYRTRSNRALLWGPTIFSVMVPLFAWLQIQGFFSRNDELSAEREVPLFFLVAVASILIAISICGWWAFYKFSIRTDEHGLTQTGWRGEKFVAWQDITDFYRSGDSFYVTAKNGTRLRFGSNIAEAGVLQDEILQRTGGAKTEP